MPFRDAVDRAIKVAGLKIGVETVARQTYRALQITFTLNSLAGEPRKVSTVFLALDARSARLGLGLALVVTSQRTAYLH